MKCPKCGDELRETDFGDQGFVVLDVCPSCEGAWFEKGELHALDDAVHTNLEEMSYVRARLGGKTTLAKYSCPACADAELEPLCPENDEHIVVDHCQKCGGFWLDPGELDLLRQMALDRDSEKHQNVEHFVRPADWSHLRWVAYCLKACMRWRQETP